MVDLATYLMALADKFDKEGNVTCADAVDNLLLKTSSLEKVAQYVGAIGYVLKQNRAMMNCVRKKRVASKGSMQDVVMSCLKEYQDGQNYHDTQWTSKYAEIISQKPNLFKTCHLSFLHDLGTAWDIETHINNVRTAAQIFKDNEIDEEKVNTILSHIETLGKMLQKETEKHPFKLAAPLRGWWSRLWNPEESNQRNPLGWGKKGRERKWHGDDLDLEIEMNNVLKKIMDMSNSVTSMQSNINRLKRKAKTWKNAPDKTKESEIIVNAIMSIDSTDWEKSETGILNAVFQLRKNKFEHGLMDEATTFLKQLDNSRVNINTSIDEIQRNMQSIRSRGALSQVRQTTNQKPNRQQLQMIQTEFETLDRIIDKIDNNPLDKQGYYHAQMAISRLNTALEPIGDGESATMEPDKGTSGWLNPSPPPVITPGTPADPAVTPDTTSIPSVPITITQDSIDAIVQHIKENMDVNKSIEVLRVITRAPKINEQIRKALSDIINALEKSTAVETTGVPAATTPASPASPPTASPPTAPTASTASTAPTAPTAPTAALPYRKGSFRSLKPEGSHRIETQHQTESATRLNNLVKLADIFDSVDKRLGDAVDNYIKTYGILQKNRGEKVFSQ